MKSNSLIDLLCEVLRPLGDVRARKMFGGYGVYCEGLMFGLVDADVFYLKADALSKVRFEAAGQKPFIYDGKTRPVAMSYWRVPERLYDEPDEMVEWARVAIQVARAVAAKKSAAIPATKPAARKTPASKKPASKSVRRKP